LAAQLSFVGLVAVTVGLALAGCGQPAPRDEQTQAVEVLIALAKQRHSSGTQRDVSAEAAQIFKVGERAETYAQTMQSLGFEKHTNLSMGRRSVLFTKDLWSRGIFGTLELRIVLPTDKDDRIETVIGKVFLHTL
jgi:hypothetical protein